MSSSTPEETALIRAAKDGRPGAFDALYYQHVDQVHRKLRAIVGSTADVDDLLQTTFVQVFRTLPRFREESRFSTWLHRIAVNVAFEHLRKRRAQRDHQRAELTDELPAPRGPHDPERALASADARHLLERVLATLHPQKRIVLALHELEGHTLDEIALLLDCSINTVGSRLRAARADAQRSLQRMLAKDARSAA